ncbi:hypothetical protein Nepgr_008731 [Nepenthes gracilis]|uniref:Uncharacterized protein n=1 Tax=Nepenthes gracilis TaxID=150966 RepID=A0AAD3SA65_NEPGR|nr:hypothetical protein Nepgr_008731 [Nepenthes gracilis]
MTRRRKARSLRWQRRRSGGGLGETDDEESKKPPECHSQRRVSWISLLGGEDTRFGCGKTDYRCLLQDAVRRVAFRTSATIPLHRSTRLLSNGEISVTSYQSAST